MGPTPRRRWRTRRFRGTSSDQPAAFASTIVGKLVRAQPADVPPRARQHLLPAAPGLDQRLRSAPPARVLDLGCGLGASSIALARAYPHAQVLGVDNTFWRFYRVHG